MKTLLNFSRFEQKMYFLFLVFFCLFGQVLFSQQAICIGDLPKTYRVDDEDDNVDPSVLPGPNGTTGSTYAWVVTAVSGGANYQGTDISGATENEITIDWGNSTAGEYRLTVTETSSDGCEGDPKILRIIINETPTASLSVSTNEICSNENFSYTITGTPNSEVEFTINGTTRTETIDNTGIFTETITPANGITQYIIALVGIENNTTTCSDSLTESETVNVLSELTPPTVTGTDICVGEDAVFEFSGSANQVVTFMINGGAEQTLTLDGSGNGSFTVNSPTADVTLEITSVSNGTCTTPITGETFTIVVNELPITSEIGFD